MPYFYFDVQEEGERRDRIGEDLPDAEVARAYAMQIAATYAGKPRAPDEDGGAIVVTIRDGAGHLVRTVRLVFSVKAA